MAIRNKLRTHLLILFSMGTIARIMYLLLALQHLGIDGLATFTVDSKTYLAMAEYILSGENSHGEEFLFWIGPGYGMLIAGIQSVFGSNYLYLIGANILFGSLAPVFIYLLAHLLTEKKSIALIAGIIVAISPTSLSLSCNILSDQPFFTIHAVALLFFSLGIKTSRMKWYLLAGLMAGGAAYVRALGQVWALAYLLLPLVLSSRDLFFGENSFVRVRTLKLSAVTAGLALLMIFAWATRNYVTEGVFVFGGNGMVASRWYVAARAVADHSKELTILDVRRHWSEEDRAFWSDAQPTTGQKYRRFRDHFLEIASEHPGWMVQSFGKNVNDNVKTGNFIARDQVPVLSSLWWKLIVANDRWLSHLIVGMSLLGVIILYWEGRRYAAYLLGATFVYFTLFTGFSLWQGSRLHYPAEIGWSILVACVPVWIFQKLSVVRAVKVISNFSLSRKILRDRRSSG